MASNDNPIDRTINDVLGLGHSPRTFSEKIEGLSRTLGVPEGHYVDVFRKDKGLSSLEGSRVASTAAEAKAMYNELVESSLLPSSARSVFDKATMAGGSFFYNEGSGSLFYGTGERVTALPLQTSYGAVSFGGRARKVNSLLNFGSGERSSFISSYYQGVGNKLDDTMGSLHSAAKGFMSSMLMEGTTTRGISTPEEALWTSRRSSVIGIEASSDFGMALGKYRTANTAFSMLTKTAGRSIFGDLQQLSADRLDYKSAFHRIGQYQQEYISALGGALSDMGDPSAFVFTKPEFLGSRGKLLSSSAMMTEMYGSQFEEGILSKGLFQLAKQRVTTQGQANIMMSMGQDPMAPYITSSQGPRDMFQQMKLRVGVVDTSNAAFSQMYFQEGGGILTPTGAKKMSLQAPMGSMRFSSPSEELIGAVERVYGVNMGAGNVQMPNTATSYSYRDHRAARKGGADLTPIQRDLRTIIQHSGKYRGLFKQLSTQNSQLAKIQLTDSKLSLDFVTPDNITPGSVETVMGGRRFTNILPGEKHPFAGLLPKETLEGIDVFIGADEFQKMMGANVYLTNFIEKVRTRDDAADIFQSTFGTEAHIAVNKKTRMIVPVITNHDDAYRQAVGEVARWHKRGVNPELIEQIEQGTRIINDKMLNKGIKGISVFGIGGALRTDFMGDINMMSPVRVTASKMITMASGASQLGYKHAYEDPMFGALAGSSKAWSSRSIGVRAGSGQLFLSSKHMMRRFSGAMLGSPGHIDPSQVLTLGEGGFSLGGKRLSRMPGMDALSHGAGGVSFDKLSDTLLGQAGDMMYLDLGKTRSLDILGTGARDYRYLPIPLEYLRHRKGTHNRLMMNQSQPAYGFIKALGDIESNRGFWDDPITASEGALQRGYSSIVGSLAGKEGLLNKTSTILMPMGTRARLAPQSGDFFNASALNDPNKLFTGVISQSEFDDYLMRKGGQGATARSQANALRRQVAKTGSFFGMLSVDPAQRAEHANVFKFMVDPDTRGTKGIGQLNLNLHPYWYRMSERDVDRDVANMVPLTGLEGTTEAALEDRMKRQAKLSRHFMWFQKYEMMKTEKLAKERLIGMDFVTRATDYLSAYLGSSKSLGYSITRASDTIMGNIAAYGVKGARDMGIMGGDISDSMVGRIAHPYLGDAERLGVTQKLLQNLYQGGVQKGTAKGGLVNLAETLVGIGQEYKGAAFDYDAVVGRTKEALVGFMNEPGMKDRSFMALDYLMEKGLVSESASFMKADLERALTEALDQAAVARGNKAAAAIIDAQAGLMAEYLGPGMALAASVKRAPRGPVNVIQKMVTDATTAEDLQGSILEPAAGELPSPSQRPIGAGESMLDEVADAAKGNFFDRAKTYFSSSKGKTFGAGLGVGALLGAGIVSTMSEPEAPMPRPVDGRQPTDRGPDIFSTQPKIYGNHQSFDASRRGSPHAIPSNDTYRFPNLGGSSITIRDRSSSSNPHMINRHMRDISNSDYVY